MWIEIEKEFFEKNKDKALKDGKEVMDYEGYQIVNLKRTWRKHCGVYLCIVCDKQVVRSYNTANHFCSEKCRTIWLREQAKMLQPIDMEIFKYYIVFVNIYGNRK